MAPEVAVYALQSLLLVIIIHAACKARIDRMLMAFLPLLMIAGTGQALTQYGGWSALPGLTGDQALDVFVSALMYGGLFLSLVLLPSRALTR
jgi:hypothetical protein